MKVSINVPDKMCTMIKNIENDSEKQMFKLIHASTLTDLIIDAVKKDGGSNNE